MIKSDEIEEMIRVGKVVGIEPMPNSVTNLQPPPEISKSEMTADDRLKLADLIVALSNNVLSKEESRHHIALRIGSPPNSNAVTVSKRANRVSFFIRSTDLHDRAKAAEFKLEPAGLGAPKNKYRYRFLELRLCEIQAHEALFREIVKESVSVIMDRRPKKK